MTEQAGTFDPRYWQWGTADRTPRMLHTMIRVHDLERSLRFYISGFGMRLLDRFDVPLRRVSAAYIGFGDFEAGGLLELTHRWDAVEIATNSFHFAIGVPDIGQALTRLEEHGAAIEMPPTVLVPGGPAVAFISDPDGYSVELIQIRRDES